MPQVTAPACRRPGLYEIGESPKRCPRCGSASSRIHRTVQMEPERQTRRERLCLACGGRYVTWAAW